MSKKRPRKKRLKHVNKNRSLGHMPKHSKKSVKLRKKYKRLKARYIKKAQNEEELNVFLMRLPKWAR